MATRYLVNFSGVPGLAHVNNTSCWSATSGGAGGESLPTSSDDVIIDDNSGFDAYNYLSVESTALNTVMRCRDLTVTVSSGKRVVFDGYYDDSDYQNPDIYIWCYRNCTLNSTCTDFIWLFFRGTTAKNLTTGGAIVGYVELVNAATLTLQDDLAFYVFTDNCGQLFVNNGTFDHNGHNVLVGDYYGSNGAINFGSGTTTIIRTFDCSYTTNNFGTCTLKVDSHGGYFNYAYDCTLLLNSGVTIPHFEITKTNAGTYLGTDGNPATITFGTFAFTSGAHMYCSPGCTYEFTAAPVQNGSTTNLTYLDNIAPGMEQNSIWSCAENVTIENLSIVRNDAEGGGVFRATGDDSEMDAYTTGWVLGAATSAARPHLLLMMVA